MTMLSEKAVKATLELIRQGADLAQSPLLTLHAIKAYLRRSELTAFNREIILLDFLNGIVTQELETLRRQQREQTTDAHRPAEEDDKHRLIEDFRHGNRILEAWSVLYYRYLHQNFSPQMQEIAQIVQSDVKYIQRRLKTGIQRLTSSITTLEEEALHRITDQRSRLLVNLPGMAVSGLIDREKELVELSTILQERNEPWVIALEGFGGMGKTALTYVAVEDSVRNHIFADIACLTAKREIFRGDRRETLATPLLTRARFLDELILQLKFGEAIGLRENEKIALLQRKLREDAYLLVIDNLETAEDYREIASLVADLIVPTKVLITSRMHLAYDYIDSLEVKPLTRENTLLFVHQLASNLHLDINASISEEELDSIYGVTGGNPLAIKLVIGLLSYYPSWQDVLVHLWEAKGETVDEFYRFVYWQSWHLLSPTAQDILHVMPLYEIGGTQEAIRSVCQLDEASFSEGMAELIKFSLVQMSGSVSHRRYLIHSLTRRFILSELAKEWSL